MTLRILLHETMDPDGALAGWCSPELAARGFSVRVFPVQEAIHALGPDGVRAAFMAVAREFGPDVVLVHPPYDFLDRKTIARLQTELGAKVVAFAFDEPLFAVARGPLARGAPRSPATGSLVYKSFCETARAFDRYATTDRASAERLAADGVRAAWVPLAASPIPLATRADVAAPAGHAVLVGRAYPRRVALVEAVRAAGIPVAVFGAGWPGHGVLRGPAMHAMLASADAVVTTADWEDVAVPMVKARLLEAAFLGARQVVQAAPDLAAYLTTPEECLVWEDTAGLVAALRETLADPAAARQRAEKARARALAEHRWGTRWDQLTEGLVLDAGSTGGASRAGNDAWCQLVAALAHAAERDGRARLAAAFFRAWYDTAPNATAAAGLERVGGADAGADAGVAATPTDAGTADGLYARVGAAHGAPRGLGAAGYLDPAPERAAWAFAATPDLTRLSACDDDFIVAMAALVTAPEEPLSAPARRAWSALFRRALAAAPRQEHLARPHRARWQAALETLETRPEEPGLSRS